MKKSLITTLLVLTAVTAFAVTSEFVCNTIASYSGGKGQITVPVSYTTPVAYQTAGTCQVFLNQTSGQVSFPVVANTLYKLQPPSGVNNLVFLCSSVALTTNTIKVMK